MAKEQETREIISLFLGTALLLIGLTWNERLIAAVFSVNGKLENIFWRLAIAVLDLASIVCGIITMVCRPRYPHSLIRAILFCASLTLCLVVLSIADCVVGWLTPFRQFHYSRLDPPLSTDRVPRSLQGR